MQPVLSPQDFARNQVGALADSVLALEPGMDDEDSDRGDALIDRGAGLQLADSGTCPITESQSHVCDMSTSRFREQARLATPHRLMTARAHRRARSVVRSPPADKRTGPHLRFVFALTFKACGTVQA